jgi:UDP-galactopyranose mutase
MYDFLIVGAGIYGAVMARQLTDAGSKVLVVEKRNRTGGNCASEIRYGIPVHLHGAHVFHTNNRYTWNYVCDHAEFYPWRTTIMAEKDNKLYPFPINLHTLSKIYGFDFTPNEAENIGSSIRDELFDFFYKDYSSKQWGMSVDELPSWITKRIPVRTTYNTNRFDSTYEGLPVGGYEGLFNNLLSGVDVRLGVDYLKASLNSIAPKVIYSGAIDALYDFKYGKLPYRSLNIDFSVKHGDYQGTICVNCVGKCHPWTKSIEYKHFLQNPPKGITVVSTETPVAFDGTNERYYPIPLDKNIELAKKYVERAENDGYIVGGRLGTYQYLEMDSVVEMALRDSWELTYAYR